MATLSFEGETHAELVSKVRRWLASVDGEDAGTLSAQDALEQGAEITKDALRIIASAAPEPIAQSEVVKALTGMGYKATDATKEALTSGLDSFDELTGGGVLDLARKTSRSAMYQMNAAVARQILRAMKG
ncbi:MAG: hypothetical protein JST73_01645 [Actinobacteria bacterium]|nr:hypothetical protein [Actinomycetota bacterium]